MTPFGASLAALRKITFAVLVTLLALDLVPVTIAMLGLPLPSVLVFSFIELAVLALTVTVAVRWYLPKSTAPGR